MTCLSRNNTGHESPSWTPYGGRSPAGWPCALAACVAAGALLAMGGCQQGVYRATSLPPELAARPALDAQSLDLSKLGSSSFRSDVIYPGDLIAVKAMTGAEQEEGPWWDLRVGQDGTVGVPLVGPVQVAGLAVSAAEHAIRQASLRRRIYRDPTIAVTIKQRRVNRIHVAGAVANPGSYELPAANSTLVAALYAAGGLRADADGTVEIRFPEQRRDTAGALQASGAGLGEPTSRQTAGRRHEVVGRIPARSIGVDLVAATASGQGNPPLADGTIVMVNKQPEQVVHVIGLAGNRSIPLPPNRELRMLDALAEAGGPKYSIWIADRVTVIRKVPGTNRSVRIKLSMSKAKRDGRENILLAAGDVVSVEENPITFTLGTLREIVGIGATAAQGAAAAAVP